MKKSIGYGRGSVYTIILKALQSGDKYGYEICKEIEEKSKGAYILKQPSLYSGLKRLEAQKDVYSYWGDSDIGGRRHYYSLTEKGKERINRTNFSWEDARADVLGDLFELSEDEKALKNIKTDVKNVTNDINEISNINNEIDKQIQRNEITDSLITTANLNSEKNINTTSQSKIERHLVNENQQDLFSLFTTPLTQVVTEENNEKDVELDDNKLVNNEDDKLSLEDSQEDKESNEIEEETDKKVEILNVDNEHIESSNEEYTRENTDCLENNEIIKENAQVTNEVAELEKNHTKSQLEVKKAIKTEASAINVQDYINSRTSSTLFDEEIKRTPIKIETPSLEKNDLDDKSLDSPLNDDEMDKKYQDFLKAFEVNDKEEETEDDSKETINTQVNTENNSSNFELSSNSNQENNNKLNIEQHNQTDNTTSSGVTFYNVNDNNQSGLNKQENNVVDSENLVFNEDFEVIDSKENSDFNDNQTLSVINNEQEKTSTFVENIANNETNISTIEKPYSVEVKKIFGDLIEDSLEVSDQEIRDLKNSIISENAEKNEFARNETKEIFEDYNKTNFKANDDLPRVNISNNINLSLNKDDYKQETKVYKSPFKSYHDDAPSSDDYYDKMYEKAYKDRFENNEKYKSLNFNDGQGKTEQTNVENNYDNDNYESNNSFANIPFDKKYEQSHKESYINSEDYVVRRYNNKNIKGLESKYLNASKFNNINNLAKILIMLFSTLIMNIIAFKFAFVTKLQQNFLACEYSIIGIYVVIAISYFLLHKNQRKIVNNSYSQILKVVLDILILTIIILLNVFVLKVKNNIIDYYATLIIPIITLSIFTITDLIMIKIKKSSFLYK